jgi:hypothetical protein
MMLTTLLALSSAVRGKAHARRPLEDEPIDLGLRSPFLWVVLAALLLAWPAKAENQVPGAVAQEILIKTSLLTLNDANITRNYNVLHSKLAKVFREDITPERLQQIFKSFADKEVDWGIIATKAPVETEAAHIDKRGALVIRGYFDTRPSRVTYELDFMPSEGEWKPVNLTVNVKPVATN